MKYVDPSGKTAGLAGALLGVYNVAKDEIEQHKSTSSSSSSNMCYDDPLVNLYSQKSYSQESINYTLLEWVNEKAYIKNEEFLKPDGIENLRYVEELDVDIGDATSDQIEMMNQAIYELRNDVANSEEIQEYYQLYNIDILDVLHGNKSPDIVIFNDYGSFTNFGNEKGIYRDIKNNVELYPLAFDSVELLKMVLIHELEHWASDIAGGYGDELTIDSSGFPQIAEKVEYYKDNYYNAYEKLTSPHGVEGYASNIILYDKVMPEY